MLRINGKKRCANCFCEIKSEPCPNCGYSKKTSATDADTLPCRTKLAKKYLVGGVIGRGGFGITYLALDIKSDKILVIKEYFPPEYLRERAKNTCFESAAEFLNVLSDTKIRGEYLSLSSEDVFPQNRISPAKDTCIPGSRYL